MKHQIVLSTLMTLLIAVSVLAFQPAVNVTKNLTSMPLAFTENQGQWEPQVLFRAEAGGAAMWFTSDGAYYQFTRRTNDAEEGLSERPGQTKATGAQEHVSGLGRDNVKMMLVKASFVGANPSPVMRGEDLLDYKCNYFLGNDPTGWRTDVDNYGAILYEQVYPGIDLKYYGNGREMEYDFIVSPGADPSRIRIQYEGVETISVNAEGELVVKTRWGEVIERRPVVYQPVNGARVPIEGRYEITGGNSFGFSIGAGYNPALPLVIDPVLSYSTYLGGSGGDYGYDLAIDEAGIAYVMGETYSTDFPTLDPYQTDQGQSDVFISKLSSDGSSLIYSTYLGGNYQDRGHDIILDESGAMYVTGFTYSTTFPVVNAYQGTNQGSVDAFVTKLNSSGNSLIYSTYLGGSAQDLGWGGIAVDESGAAYISGQTFSPDFPTVNPFQASPGDPGLLYGDAFVSKLGPDGSYLVYSTYLGGTGEDNAHDLVIDDDGSAYVTGYTSSPDFPTQNPMQPWLYGGCDAFVTKFSVAGTSLVYSTYLGGSSSSVVSECSYGIAVDESGAAYVTGNTASPDFPIWSAYQWLLEGENDAFITKLNADGNTYIYSTYLGGNGDDLGWALVINDAGEAYVTGYTASVDFPLEDPYQDTYQGGTMDVFVTKLSSDGTSLGYSTYLGGNDEDYAKCMALDLSDAVYVTGLTASTDFPIRDPYQAVMAGACDAFVTKLVEGTSCCELRGDLDDNQQVDVLDLDYFIDWLYRTGPAPDCEEEANVDGNSQVDILDIDYFIDWLYRDGPDLVPCP